MPKHQAFMKSETAAEMMRRLPQFIKSGKSISNSCVESIENGRTADSELSGARGVLLEALLRDRAGKLIIGGMTNGNEEK